MTVSIGKSMEWRQYDDFFGMLDTVRKMCKNVFHIL